MNKFFKDLKKGNNEEVRFANWLIRNNKNIKEIIFRQDGWFDLSVIRNGEWQTFEIKGDFFSHDERQYKNITVPGDSYNTLFIEFESYGKRSGIKTTLADYWVIVLTLMDEIWIIPTKELREIIEENSYSQKRFEEKKGGDDKMSKGYLIPRDKYKHKFKIFKDEQPDYGFRDEFNIQYRLEQGNTKQNEFTSTSEHSRIIFDVLEEYYGVPNIQR